MSHSLSAAEALIAAQKKLISQYEHQISVQRARHRTMVTTYRRLVNYCDMLEGKGISVGEPLWRSKVLLEVVERNSAEYTGG